MVNEAEPDAPEFILTYKYRLKDKSAAKRLRVHAWAVNQVWNYCNAVQRDIEARYRAGAPKRRWPTSFALQRLTVGTSKDLGIHAQTISNVCDQYAKSRDKAKHSLRFRVSGGPRRALGWVPFQRQSRQVRGNGVTYLGHTFRWFGSKRRPLPESAKAGAFVEDAQGRWWVTFFVAAPAKGSCGDGAVGIDLGLKSLAALSTGDAIANPRVVQQWAVRLAVAQRASKKCRVKAIHTKIANIRRDHLHKTSRALVAHNSFIAVGNVSAANLAKTKMAKSVLDASWGTLKNMLKYKCQQAGAVFVEVDECWTSQVCSGCGSNPASSPKGIGALGIRAWVCTDCGASHDRDVNAARNILRLALSAERQADGSREVGHVH